MSQFEHGVIEALRHIGDYGNHVHVIPDVGVASVYIPGQESSVATLDSFAVVSESLREQNIGIALLGIVHANIQDKNLDHLDTTLTDLEIAEHFRKTFGEKRVKVERHNAQTMEFEEAGLSLSSLIIFLQNSPLRYLPSQAQHVFKLTAQLEDDPSL